MNRVPTMHNMPLRATELTGAQHWGAEPGPEALVQRPPARGPPL